MGSRTVKLMPMPQLVYYLTLASLAAPITDSEQRVPIFSAPQAAIVVGTVVKVVPAQEYKAATIKINRVVCGDGFHVGDEFTARTDTQEPNERIVEPVVVPILAKNEVAIWYVIQGQHQVHLARLREMHLDWPVRNEKSPEFEAALHHGAQMKSVEDAVGEAAGIARLTELVADPSPETSCWAVTKLAELARRTEHADLRPLFWEYAADRKLTALARFAADDALLRFDHEKWRASPLREQLALECVSSVFLPREARVISRRLDSIAQHPKLEGYTELTTLLALFDRAVSNDRFPQPWREYIPRYLSVVPTQYENDQPAFDWLARQVRTCKDADLQRGAAYTLVGMSTTPARMATLRELVPLIKDDAAKRHALAVTEGG